jgi:hypothetical protein
MSTPTRGGNTINAVGEGVADAGLPLSAVVEDGQGPAALWGFRTRS